MIIVIIIGFDFVAIVSRILGWNIFYGGIHDGGGGGGRREGGEEGEGEYSCQIFMEIP